MLERVVARRVQLVGLVRGHPEVVVHEARALADHRLRVGERPVGAGRQQLVAARLAHVVARRRVDDLPVAARERVDVALGARLRREGGLADRVRVAVGVVGAHRLGDGVDLHHGVARAVDVEVEAGAEQVLVVGGEQARLDLRRRGVVRARHAGAGQHDAGQLGLELDRAVLVEVPEVAVLVVVDRRDLRRHEAAPAAHLDVAVGVGVLPEDPEVLLVEADAVLDDVDLALGVDRADVEVDDLAEAVAAQGQRVGVVAEPELARVEGGLAGGPVDAGVAVRDHELGDRHAPRDRALGAVVVEADVVDDEALALAVAEPEAPALPADLPAVDLERGALGLDDLERLQRHRAAGLGQAVRPGRLRRRDAVGVLDVDDLGRVHRDDGVQAADRVGVLVGVGGGAVPHRRPDQPPAVVEVRGHVDPERPGLHVHLGGVVDAAAAQALDHARVVAGGLEAGDRLRPEHRGLLAGLGVPAAHRAVEADHGLDQEALRAVPDGDPRRAVDRVARRPRRERLLRRLVEQREDEEVVAGQALLATEDRDRLGELLGGERIERVRRHAGSMGARRPSRQSGRLA